MYNIGKLPLLVNAVVLDELVSLVKGEKGAHIGQIGAALKWRRLPPQSCVSVRSNSNITQ